MWLLTTKRASCSSTTGSTKSCEWVWRGGVCVLCEREVGECVFCERGRGGSVCFVWEGGAECVCVCECVCACVCIYIWCVWCISVYQIWCTHMYSMWWILLVTVFVSWNTLMPRIIKYLNKKRSEDNFINLSSSRFKISKSSAGSSPRISHLVFQ